MQTQADAILAANIAKGIWYRRKTGGMYGAKLIDGDRVEFIPLHPNTLEDDGPAKTLPTEHFYCFYCRRDQLERA